MSATDQSGRASVGVVVIGRNEGERLLRCLRSVQGQAALIVYVDSGSTDGSASAAAALGVVVHALDMRRPFTAARARNEGVQRLMALEPTTQLIQFVDGDCEVVAGWLDAAVSFLQQRADVAAVCGRRREREPERSIYNLLCDLEWATPIGEARACGGDVTMRSNAFREVGGFRESLIAGEEPELCVRLRAAGWKIWRLDHEMTLHDASMTHFAQWWKRCMRAGFAYAEGVRLHGAPPERHWVREARSGWCWAAVLPLVILFAAATFGAVAWWGLMIYPVQVIRLGLRFSGDAKARWARAFFLVAGKFPEVLGQIKSMWAHARHRETALIEYK